ncbi:hypothetical protein WG922_02770 [Ramlibacter sp. AN1015]|uniref:hypothetical protein n=1 Tax=Ramlibacter sp. AN1015 TaxID=3133428 RepID=UPI0030C277D6
MVATRGAIRVHGDVQTEQTVRAVGALADGGWALAWQSDGALHLRRLDAAGESDAGAPIALPFAPGEGVSELDLAVLPSGSVVVAYTTLRMVERTNLPPLAIAAVHYRAFGADGTAAAAGEVTVAEITFEPNYRSPSLMAPRVVALSDGGFVVGWGIVQPSSVTVRTTFQAQRFDMVGAALGERVVLGKANSPGAASYRLFADAWGGWGAAVNQLDETYEPDNVLVHYRGADLVRMAGRSDGAWLLPLEGTRYVLFDRDAQGSFMRIAGADGSMGERRAAPALPIAARELADGSFVVLWPGEVAPSAQLFDRDARAFAGAFALEPGAAAAQLAALREGGFAVGWTDARGAGVDAFTQLYFETPARPTAAARAQWQSCLTQARGTQGQRRQQLLDQCMD